ncbi:MAG: 3-oxoacyl-ACP synthase [Rhodocyclales bacterium]|jgi:3-oxoacyl-[acyl-carrier-protein] synthase-3|nr:3-oxoacyl-ACP synthase [Rhodocyclales bacterium]
MNHVGVLGYGFYLPDRHMSAADIAAATGGAWSEEAVREKLGIVRKSIPGPEDGTQEMGARAALDAIARTGIDPLEIDLILCMGEEWKEYPLTTSAIYIQERIGAHRAWGIDIQQRCNTSVAAIKIAKDMLIADPEIATVMIVGGYRNGDLIDFRDSAVSFMFDLAAGAGALILRRNLGRNLVLGSHIITDGSLARDVGVWLGGTEHPIESLPEAELAVLRARGNLSLRVFEPEHMKARLNEVSMPNWLACIDKALAKSGATRADIDFLNVLHFKRSMHASLLETLDLGIEQSVYLENYGHLGQVDLMLSIHEGLRQGRLKDGDLMVAIAAGIGYVWGATVVRWGPAQ